MNSGSVLDACLDSRACIFLGAGANVSLGFPLMSDLTTAMAQRFTDFKKMAILDIYNNRCKNKDIECILDELHEVIHVLETINMNRHLHDLMSFGDAQRNNINKSIENYKNIIRDLELLIYKSVDISYSHDLASEIYSELLEFVLSHLSINRVIPIITTNYDIVIENLGNNNRDRRIYDGYQIEETGAFKRDVWSGYDVPQEKILANIVLFKLHGSIGWHQTKEKRTAIKVIDIGMTDSSDIKSLFVLPRIRKKEMYDEFSIYDDIHSATRDIVERTDVIIFVGYSLRDEHINEYIISELKRGEKKIIIFDPSAELIEKRLCRIIGRNAKARILKISEAFEDKYKIRTGLDAIKDML